MKKRCNKVFCLLFIIPLIVFGLSAIVMLLWNAVVPDVTGFKSISYWQAMGLMLLCKILFGGFRGGFHKWKQANESCGPNPEQDCTSHEKFKEMFKSKYASMCKKNQD